MPHTRDEVSYQKGPASATFKPGMYPRQHCGCDVDVGAILHQHICVEDTPKRVANGDSAGAAAKCCSERWEKQQCSLEDEITGKGKQPFIWNRQSDDSECQEREESAISILADPLEGNLCHLRQVWQKMCKSPTGRQS